MRINTYSVPVCLTTTLGNDTVIIPVSQKTEGKLRHREIKWLVQGHGARCPNLSSN
jgi:hypothetical protein